MIRTVQEFNCEYGRCREVQLAEGAHDPVRLSVEQMRDGVDVCGTAFTPALRIEYLGRRRDLIALGCISRETLASGHCDQYTDDPRGGMVRVTRSTHLRGRGMLKVSYFAQTRLLAAMLPGMHRYCADWLETLTGRPRLRLVIDNTGREPSRPAKLPAA